MYKMYDYECAVCAHQFEALLPEGAEATCPQCHESPAGRRATGGHLFTVITPTTLTSKRYKAGYVHKYQKRAAEKTSVQVPLGPTNSLE